MSDRGHIEMVRANLMTLRGECLDLMDGRTVEFFDEFLREEEFELALHIVCDLVIEKSAAISQQGLEGIVDLHRIMGIQDDCVDEIRNIRSRRAI